MEIAQNSGSALSRTWALQLGRLDLAEAGFCVRANHVARQPTLRSYFALVSRLGDGVAWYLLLLMLPIGYGAGAIGPALHMALTTILGVLVYKVLKSRLVRERPFAAGWASGRSIEAVVAPLDRYSFPSGHTLHAAAFTVMIGHYFPELLIAVAPFALSVAASRVILGLHYPSDVVAGGLLGGLIAWSSFLLPI
jgi:undecaprenyl-diphosphatase